MSRPSLFARVRLFDEIGQGVAYWAALPRCPVTTPQPEHASAETEASRCPVVVNERARLSGETTGHPLPGPAGPIAEANPFSKGMEHSGVSLEAEVPEALFIGMRDFIRTHPQWDQYSLITSALACFLFQNGARESCVKDHYLATLFSDS